MIWWPFINEYEFILIGGQDSPKCIELTKGFKMESRFIPSVGIDKLRIDIHVNGHHTQLTQFWEAAIITVRRKKDIIEVSINSKWKQSYYLKTPIIWKSKKLK